MDYTGCLTGLIKWENLTLETIAHVEPASQKSDILGAGRQACASFQQKTELLKQPQLAVGFCQAYEDPMGLHARVSCGCQKHLCNLQV